MNSQNDNKFINFFLYKIDEVDTSILAIALLIPFFGNFWYALQYYFYIFFSGFGGMILTLFFTIWLIMVIINAVSKRIPSEVEKYHLAQVYFVLVSMLSIIILTADEKSLYSLPTYSVNDGPIYFYLLFNKLLTWFFLLKSVITMGLIRSINRYSTLLVDKYENNQMSFFHLGSLILIMPIIYAIHHINNDIIASVYLTFVYTSGLFFISKLLFKFTRVGNNSL